jgi:hypothetical protein
VSTHPRAGIGSALRRDRGIINDREQFEATITPGRLPRLSYSFCWGVERAARHQLNPRRSFLPPSILHDSQQDIGTGMPGLGRDDAFRIVRVAGLIGLRHSEQGYVGRRVTDDVRDVCELEFGHGV